MHRVALITTLSASKLHSLHLSQPLLSWSSKHRELDSAIYLHLTRRVAAAALHLQSVWSEKKTTTTTLIWP